MPLSHFKFLLSKLAENAIKDGCLMKISGTLAPLAVNRPRFFEKETRQQTGRRHLKEQLPPARFSGC